LTLSTASSTNFFTPTATQWRTDTVNLNSFIGNSILVSFQNTNEYGNALYIDNIKINGISINGIGNVTNNVNGPNIKVIPNPFTDNTTFIYSLTEVEHVRLSISNMMGKEIKVLCDNKQGAGEHKLVFDAKDYPAGIYYYKIAVGNKITTGKIILVK